MPARSRDTAERIIARIARKLGAADLIDGLAQRLAPADLQSLLLHVLQRRSAVRTPAELLAQYQRAPMCRISDVDTRALFEVERAILDSADGFSAVELAPVAPLGINSVLGQIDQNNCLATIRSAEVLADATTALALECAHRRKNGNQSIIKLCSSSRQLRLQPINSTPGFSPHFALFSMVSAGRDVGSFAFEAQQLSEHLSIYLSVLRRLNQQNFRFAQIEVTVSDTARDERHLDQIETEVFACLVPRFPEVGLHIDRHRERGMRYYSGPCLAINAVAPDSVKYNIGDGGCTDWTQRLLSNAKERLLVSGIGIELMAKLFYKSATD